MELLKIQFIAESGEWVKLHSHSWAVQPEPQEGQEHFDSSLEPWLLSLKSGVYCRHLVE